MSILRDPSLIASACRGSQKPVFLSATTSAWTAEATKISSSRSARTPKIRRDIDLWRDAVGHGGTRFNTTTELLSLSFLKEKKMNRDRASCCCVFDVKFCGVHWHQVSRVLDEYREEKRRSRKHCCLVSCHDLLKCRWTCQKAHFFKVEARRLT
jgi:hypothetical protein